MRRLISIFLIICLAIMVLPGNAWAWPPTNSDTFVVLMATSVAVISLLIFTTTSHFAGELQKKEGWIKTEGTLKESAEIVIFTILLIGKGLSGMYMLVRDTLLKKKSPMNGNWGINLNLILTI